MLNWLKSGELSGGTSEAISNKRGEGQRERVRNRRREKRRGALGRDREKTSTGRRRRPRRRKGYHRQTGSTEAHRGVKVKKEETRVSIRLGKIRGNMMTIIWVWASLGLAMQIARSHSACCAVRFWLTAVWSPLICAATWTPSMPVQVRSPLHFLDQNWKSYKTAKNNCSLIHVLGLHKTHYGLHIWSVTE